MFDDRAPLSTEMDEVKEKLLACMEEFVDLGDRILAIRRVLPPERTHEAQKMAAYLQQHPGRARGSRRAPGALEDDSRGDHGAQDLSRNQTLLDLLLVYNMVNRRELAVSEDGALYEKPLFEKSYFTERAGLADEYYHNVLVYALVEFLRACGNRDKLRGCPDCKTFFIAGPRRAKGKKCSRCAKKKGRGTRE